jgi:hypothetical protein
MCNVPIDSGPVALAKQIGTPQVIELLLQQLEQDDCGCMFDCDNDKTFECRTCRNCRELRTLLAHDREELLRVRNIVETTVQGIKNNAFEEGFARGQVCTKTEPTLSPKPAISTNAENGYSQEDIDAARKAGRAEGWRLAAEFAGDIPDWCDVQSDMEEQINYEEHRRGDGELGGHKVNI